MRLLHRAGLDAIAERLITAALERELVVAQRRLQRDQVLVHDFIATLDVDAEYLVFGLQVTGAEPARDATLRIQIERRDRARSDERIAIRQHENDSLPPERRRRRGNERQQHERVMRMMAAAVEPASGREIGRASCRERAGRSVSLSVVSALLKKIT